MFNRGSVLCAIAICQCVTPPALSLALNFIQEAEQRKDMSLIDSMRVSESDRYISCLWEIPLLEMVVYILHSKRVFYKATFEKAIRLLRSPGLNMYNGERQRKFAINSRKRDLVINMMHDLMYNTTQEYIYVPYLVMRERDVYK